MENTRGGRTCGNQRLQPRTVSLAVELKDTVPHSNLQQFLNEPVVRPDHIIRKTPWKGLSGFK